MSTGPQSFSIDDAKKIASTSSGKQLIALIKKAGNQDLQSVLEDAKSGDYETMRQKLEPLLASPEVQELLRQIGGK